MPIRINDNSEENPHVRVAASPRLAVPQSEQVKGIVIKQGFANTCTYEPRPGEVPTILTLLKYASREIAPVGGGFFDERGNLTQDVMLTQKNGSSFKVNSGDLESTVAEPGDTVLIDSRKDNGK